MESEKIMNIKLDFASWMPFVELKGKFTIREAITSTNIKWHDIGLKSICLNPSDLSRDFAIIDKQLFFLPVIKYGINYEELLDVGRKRC